MSTLPMIVCKLITTYKSQWFTVGPSKVWEQVVILLATGRRKKAPGAELVGFSRAIESEMTTIENPLHQIDRMGILKLE